MVRNLNSWSSYRTLPGYHMLFEVRNGKLQYAEAAVECYCCTSSQEIVLEGIPEEFKSAAIQGAQKALFEIGADLSIAVKWIGFNYCDTTDDNVIEATKEATLKAARHFTGTAC